MKFEAAQLNTSLLPNSKPLPQTGSVKDLNMARIDAVAVDFEASFLSEMFKPIFESVEVNETFGGCKTEEIFGGFLRDEYSKMLASTGSIGIADLVKEELIEMQSRAQNAKVAQIVHGSDIQTIGDGNV